MADLELCRDFKDKHTMAALPACCFAVAPVPETVPVPCAPEGCPCEGPLRFFFEFDRLSSVCSRLLRCPDEASSFWRCADAKGEASSLAELQAVQATLEAPYRDSSAVRVRKCAGAGLDDYCFYCVFAGPSRLGPFPFGSGFPLGAVCDAVQLVLLPCALDSEAPLGLAFCEFFACTLALSVRPPPPPKEPDYRLSICGSIPWKCAYSNKTWDAFLDKGEIGGALPLNRPAWRDPLPGPRAQYFGTLTELENFHGSCDIWINDTSVVEIPLTTSYASLPRLLYASGGPPGAGQADLDAYILGPLRDSRTAPASPFLDCVVTWAGDMQAALKSARTDSSVRVRGTGVLDGSRLAREIGTGLQQLRTELVSGSSTFGQVLKRMEYEILSGLLELDATGEASSEDAAIDAQGLQVLSPPKRYRSAVQLNGYNAWPASAGVPPGSVHVFDFKILGGWIDASDGPETLAAKSTLGRCLYHVADDAVKLGASALRYTDVTLLQGNAGGAVNVGCFGVLPAPISDISASGFYVQRVCQLTDQADGLGGLVTSRNVCGGGSVSACTVSRMVVPFLGGARTAPAAAGEEVPIRGPNAYWRVAAIGFQVGGAFSGPSLQQTTMDNIDLLALAPRFPPLGPAGGWFLYYWQDSSGGSAGQRRLARLGQMRLTLAPDGGTSRRARREAREVYSESACRVHTLPQDPLRTEYFVCANNGTPNQGVDSCWLEGLRGYDVPANVTLQRISPKSVLTPVRKYVAEP